MKVMNSKTGKKEKALFSVKEFLSEQELDNTPEKQVFPAVSCKLATVVFLHTQTIDSPCQKQTIFLAACKSLSSVFFMHQKQILFIYIYKNNSAITCHLHVK